MTKQELYALFNPDIYKIDTGGSCVSKAGGTNWDLWYNEIRVLSQANNDQAWKDIQKSLDLLKRFTVNIDHYITRTNHWLPNEYEYKTHVDLICQEVIRRAGSQEKANLIGDMTGDNEPLKWNYMPDIPTYIKYLRWLSEVAHTTYGFDISGGNEEFALIEYRIIVDGWPNLINEMCKLYVQGIIQKIAYHLQGSCMTDELRARWLEMVQIFHTRFDIRHSIVTEANYENPAKTMYTDWIPLIKMALDIGAEAIGFVFIDYTYNPIYSTDYTWLTIFKDGVLKQGMPKQAWLDFREISIKYHKEIKMEYNRPVDLQAVYDALNIKTPYRWKNPNLYVVGEKNPNSPLTWADMDALTETQMKAIIYGLKTAGALPPDFPDYPDIKYGPNGEWLGKVIWEAYAKSNPKL